MNMPGMNTTVTIRTLVTESLDIVYSTQPKQIVVGQMQVVPKETDAHGHPTVFEQKMIAEKVVTDRAIGAVVRYMIPALEPGCDTTLIVSVDGKDYELSLAPCGDDGRD